jgi:hypothetical protein
MRSDYRFITRLAIGHRLSTMAAAALLGIVGSGAMAQAQVYPLNGSNVPPPPTMAVPGPIGTPVGQPLGQPVGTSGMPIGGGYRVIVNGDGYDLLHRVKKVVPDAFQVGPRLIQAGEFSSEYGARTRVSELANAGIPAAIYGPNVGGNPTPNPGIPATAKGYYAVVPTNGELAKVVDRMRMLGLPDSALNLRQQPYGQHIAIGPYPKREDADAMSQWLRNGGLDARAYFSR